MTVDGASLPEHAPEGTVSLRHHFREHRIDLRSMPLRLRIVTAIALADLVAAVVLLALRDVVPPLIPIGTPRGTQPLALPLVVLVFGTVFFIAGLGYLLAGALHSHALVGLAATGLLAYLFWPDRIDAYNLAVLAILFLVAAGVVMSAATDLVARRNGRPAPWRIRRVPSVVSVAVIAVLCGLVAAEFNVQGRPAAIGLGLQSVLVIIVTLAIPVFILAGSDIGEWAQLMAHRATTPLARLRAGVSVTLTGLVVASTVVGAALSGDANLPRSILPSALFLAVVAGLTWWSRRRAVDGTAVPSRSLIATSLVYSAPLIITALAPVLIGNGTPPVPALATYRHEEAPAFALDYPPGWSATPVTAGPVHGVRLLAPQRAALVSVWVQPYSTADMVAPALRSLCACDARVSSTRLDGDYRDTTWELTDPSNGQPVGRVETWGRNTAAYSLLVLGGTTDDRFPSFHASFLAIRDSVALGPDENPAISPTLARAIRTQQDNEYRDSVIAMFALLIAAVAWLAWGSRRGHLRAAAITVVLVSTLFLLRYGPPQVAVALGRDGGAFPALDIQGVQIALGAAALVWLAVRRRLATPARWRGLAAMLSLVVAVQVLGWFDGLYTGSQKIGGTFTILQAVLVLLAMLWDLAMSGKTVTNGSSASFPRQSRVLLFCGYSMTVATAVLVLSSMHLARTGAALPPGFESDAWPQFGITFLGLPMVFAAFALVYSHHHRADSAREGTAPTPSKPESSSLVTLANR